MKGHSNRKGRKGTEISKNLGEKLKDGYSTGARGHAKTFGKPRSRLSGCASNGKGC